MYFRYVDLKQSLNQIHVAKLINYEIDENVFFFVSVNGGNVVIEDEFSFSTTTNKTIYILRILKQKKVMNLNYRCHSNI